MTKGILYEDEMFKRISVSDREINIKESSLLLTFRRWGKCPELANVTNGSSYLQNNSGSNRSPKYRPCSDEGRSTKERSALRGSTGAGPDEVGQSSLARLNSRNRHCLQWI